MTSFPLLHLPRLALIEVLKEMGIMELLQLAQTSTNISHVVRNNLTNKFTVNFIILRNAPYFGLQSKNESLKIEIVSSHNYEIERNVVWRIENQNISTKKLDAETIHVLFDDLTFGQIVIGQYLISLFKCTFDLIQLSTVPQESFERLEELFTNLEVQRLRIYSENTENVRFVLDKVKIVQKLTLESPHNPEFPLPIIRNGPKDIMIHYASWVTLEHLQGLNFEKLFMLRSTFTNKDIESFLTDWKRGKFPSLKHILVLSHQINDREAIGGMMPPIGNTEETTDTVYKFIFGCPVPISGNVEIERDDGVTAKMFVKTQSECKSFSLSVCD